MPFMNAYSKDLRLKGLSAIDWGIPRKEVADLFGVSLSTIERWLNSRRQARDVNAYKIPSRPSVKGKALGEWVPSQLKRNPDLTLSASYQRDASQLSALRTLKLECWCRPPYSCCLLRDGTRQPGLRWCG